MIADPFRGDTPMTRRRGLLAAGLPLLAAPRLARAQDNWPSRPIRMINPWTPGGPADLVARPIIAKMAEALGQPVVLENRPGANGTIGAEFVARATPDGYTLLFSQVGPIAIAPAIQARLPYDPLRDFSPITRVVSAPTVLVVRSDHAIRRVADLIARARARPGALSYGSVGPGPPAAQVFRFAVRTPAEHSRPPAERAPRHERCDCPERFVRVCDGADQVHKRAAA